MLPLAVRSLSLTDFRNYGQLRLTFQPGPLVFYGANGAGKTNLLEAISLLTPGRGLRRAALSGLTRRSSIENNWAIAAELMTPSGVLTIGTGLVREEGPEGFEKREKRVVKVDGKALRSQNGLADHVAAVWLTPEMDRLLAEGAGERRRFLDRLCYAFDPAHAGRVTRFENAARERTRLLMEGRGDPAWLSGLEAEMARSAVAVAAARVELVSALNREAARRTGGREESFPRAALTLTGFLEDRLQQAMPALAAEDAYRASLAERRGEDAAGGGEEGPRRSDFTAYFAEKGMAAADCSTGEQKALMLSLLLAHLRLIRAQRGAPPLLLLDDVAAHLDAGRRADLFALLAETGAQVFMTGPDRAAFSALQGVGAFYQVDAAVDGICRQVA